MSVGACSSAEVATAGYDQGTGGFGGDTSDSDPAGTGTGEGDAEGEGEGDGDGDGDGDSTAGMGPDDPQLDLDECDPELAQLLVYDLSDVQAEFAAPLVRESVLAGSGKVPSIPLGTQPFLNRFEFNYAPAPGPTLEVSGELWKPTVTNPDLPARYRLQYAIRAPEMLAKQRSPVDLAIVVDIGPGMAGEPLQLAELALAAVESSLVPGDRVTLIAAGEEPAFLTDSVEVGNFGATPFSGKLGDLGPATTANVQAALEFAYASVESQWNGQGQPRVLLISNGHFAIDASMVAVVADNASEGRYLVELALGDPSGVATEPLQQLAAEGRGALLYDRDADQIAMDMQDRFTAHMIAAATELQVSLSLPPGLAIRERDLLMPLLPRDPNDPNDPNDGPKLALLGPNESLVMHHEIESCGLVAVDAVIHVEVEWIDPATNEAKLLVWDQPVAELGFGSLDTRKGAATVAYVRALRGYRDGKPATETYGAVLDAISLIAEALETQPNDPDLIEMSQVLGKLEG